MKTLIPFIGLTLLVSCENDFGDKVKDFVDDEVPGLSKQIAVSGIERRMHEGKFLALAEMSLEARVLERAISKVEANTEVIASAKDSSSALRAYDYYYGQEAKVLSLLSDVVDAKRKRLAFVDICETADHHELQNLVNAEMFNIAAPEVDYTFSISSDWMKTLIDNIASLFGSESMAKQVGVMEKAIAKIPKKIVTQEELETIYAAKCEEVDKKLESREIAARNVDYLDKIRDLAFAKLETLEKAKIHVVSLYYEFRTQDIYRETGLDVVEARRIEFEKVQSRMTELNRSLAVKKKAFTSSENAEELVENHQRFLAQAFYNKNFLNSMKHRWYTAELDIKTIDRQIQMMKAFFALKMKVFGRDA